MQEKGIKVGFLARHGGSRPAPKPYSLETFALPPDFGDDLATALLAEALAQLAPAADTQGRGRYLVSLLTPVAERLRPLVQPGGAPLLAEKRGLLLTSFGAAALVIGEEAGL